MTAQRGLEYNDRLRKAASLPVRPCGAPQGCRHTLLPGLLLAAVKMVPHHWHC